MSQHHHKIKNDPRWHEAKRQCHERDGWACVRCGSTDRLQADHIVRLSEAPELAFDVDNLQTLCGTPITGCHQAKEKEYDDRTEIRVEWINPKYPELGFVIERESEESEQESDLFF